MSVQLEDAAKDYLAEVGYNPLFGARPLKRAIYKELQVPLSKALLAGDFRNGDKILVTLGKVDGARTLIMKGAATA